MISLKAGVRLADLASQMLVALMVAERVWAQHGVATLTITSANDGSHKDGSLHYQGRALDLRIHTMEGTQRVRAVKALTDALGGAFDVLHEYLGTPNEHVHVEWDP